MASHSDTREPIAMCTYRKPGDANADRARQRELLKALGASELALQRDECGACVIVGRKGHIYTWDDHGGGWVISCCPGTPRKWSSLKRRLNFSELTQDGDDEGCFRLRDLPTPEQAVVIRRAVGLRKRLPPTKGDASRFKSARSPAFEGSQDATVARDPSPVPRSGRRQHAMRRTDRIKKRGAG